MKRFYSILFAIALLAGTVAPFSTTISGMNGIRLEANAVHAETTTVKTTGVDNTYAPPANAKDYLDGCSFVGSENSIFPGCLEQLFYYIPYTFGSWAMAVAAQAFDAAANLTLSSTLYTTGSNFLEKGWTVTRDFANIFFILILLFIALSLVLDIEVGHANPKKMLVSVITIAILINFSFFMTEVIIDVSNSLALVFYNQISVINKDNQTVDNSQVTSQIQGNKYISASAVKPLSVALVKAFTPQVFSSPEFYNKLQQVGSRGFFSPYTGDSSVDKSKTGGHIDALVIIPILLIVGLMFLVVAYAFGVALISLIGRLIGLWIAIIFAPLAFVSFIIPSARHIPGFGWDEWISGLLKNAFAAPIYFFFLLLISLLTQISLVPAVTDPAFAKLSPGILLVLVILQFAIVITMLLQGTKYVRSAAGAIGEMIFKGAGALGGFAMGTAGLAAGTGLGAVAVGGQKAIGGLGRKIADSSTMKKWAEGKGGNFKVAGIDLKFGSDLKQWAGKNTLMAGVGLTKSSFDARHTGVANWVSKTAGVNLGSFGALSTKKTAGGLEASIHRETEKDEKMKKLLGHDGEEKKKVDTAIDKRKKDIEDTKSELDQIKSDKKEFSELNKKIDELRTRPIQEGPTDTEDDLARKEREKAAEIETYKAQAEVIKERMVETDPEGNKTEKSEATIQNKLNKFKRGERDKAKKRTVKNGYTKEQALEDMSLEEMEKISKNVENDRFKSYLHYQAQRSNYHTGPMERDAYGNATDFHVDTKTAVRNWGRAFEDAAKTTGKYALVGTIAGPVGTLVGGITGGIVSLLREAADAIGQGNIGVRIAEAESAHHNIEALKGTGDKKDAKHDHSAEVYKPGQSKVGTFLTSIFGGIVGGGGGGHKPSGGGGHAPAAHH